MLFSSSSFSNTHFSCIYTIVPWPTQWPIPVIREKGWRARGRRSPTPPVWICRAEIRTGATFALCIVHILSQADISPQIFDFFFFFFVCFMLRTKKESWQIQTADGKTVLQLQESVRTVCVWHRALCCKWYVSNNRGGGLNKTLCLLTYPGETLPPAPLMHLLDHRKAYGSQ